MKKEESSNTYRSILKGTSIFGGVQIFNILINLVRGKFVAVILGPEGMGIASLFNSVMATIQRFASLGLNQAIVKETAETSEDKERSGKVVATVRQMIRFTGILGLIICVAFCVPLSRLTFGSDAYAWQFILLGVAVCLTIAANGKLAILQGFHQVKKISRASIVGGLTGLCVGVPLYYFFGDKGIVPAITVLSLSLYIFYSVNLRKTGSYERSRENIRNNLKEALPLIKRLLMLGIVLMASDLIGSLVTYLINLFIRIEGSIDDVGLFQAANSVTNQYSGLVFAAMAMDYFPRLSKAVHNNEKFIEIVNRQTEIVSLLIAPAMCVLILSAPLLIRVLLDEQFESITPLMRWMGLGILFKALSFPMGYISFAKGNKKVFFLLEGITGNLLYLIICCLGFYFFGLIGLGYALVLESILAIIIYYIVNRRLYGYHFSSLSLRGFAVAIFFGILCFASSYFSHAAISYSFMGVVGAVSVFWSLRNIKSKLLT